MSLGDDKYHRFFKKMLDENDLDRLPRIVYYPKNEETQLVRFQRFVEKEHNIKFSDYWKFHEWTYKNFPEFWDCVWRFFDIVHSKPYTEVYDRKNGFESMEWFKGARLNYAENLLKYRDSKVAIIATDYEDNDDPVTYKELYEEVRVYAKAMRDEGIQKGDNIACYMSNKKEAVIAFLATAAIGAVWSGTLPLLGTKSVLSRFEQIKPKILFTAGNFTFDDKKFNLMERLHEITADIPSLERVVFCPGKKNRDEDISGINKCIYISDFLKRAREELQDDPRELEFEQLPFDHPLSVSFTSGTTGEPKGLVHSAGMYFASLKDFGLHHNCTREDVLYNQSPVGWISWNMLVNALHLGLTLVLYDGDPVTESPTRFWDLVDKFGITSTYLWSSTVEFMDVHGWGPTPKHSLKTLKQLIPMGSPVKPSSFEFLTEKSSLACSAAQFMVPLKYLE
ncbi:acetoacetyl-CoA synthetase [Caerostris darwini]|uniref:Acetoacetyl-CoA synthetase n=1 Tax=Caerostris darwini TaxID=1538125 RepID=A0AAV4S389_9ARAC|nr:acetoacetyl-CoA synthetase [Caerostris darwini]